LAHESDDPNSAAPQSPDDPTSAATSSSYIAHHLLPNVSAATPLKHPDGRFLDSEAFTDKFAHHLSSVMERVNRRVFKRWGERSHGASELGAVINGLSLDLDDGAAKELLEGVGAGVRGVQEAVERFGQAVDAEHMSTSVFVSWGSFSRGGICEKRADTDFPWLDSSNNGNDLLPSLYTYTLNTVTLSANVYHSVTKSTCNTN